MAEQTEPGSSAYKLTKVIKMLYYWGHTKGSSHSWNDVYRTETNEKVLSFIKNQREIYYRIPSVWDFGEFFFSSIRDREEEN